uniref:CKLF like MARVEL transmembrane domain containing 1 n=1 Tax=Sus scrofa TaxID=9823 RepID=A0A8D1XMC1_PIG
NIQESAGSAWIGSDPLFLLGGLGGRGESAGTTLSDLHSPPPGWLAARRWWGFGDLECPGWAAASHPVGLRGWLERWVRAPAVRADCARGTGGRSRWGARLFPRAEPAAAVRAQSRGPSRTPPGPGSSGDPEDDDAPSEDWKPRGRPRRPGGMAGWGRRGRSVHPSASVHPTGSASRPPSASRLKAARKPEPPSEREKAAIQKRAEGRAKVPPRFRDSVQRFFLSPTGLLKIIRLGLLLGALVCFISVEAQESYIAVTILEICIDVLFILMYMLTLHRLMTYLHWPLL